MIGAWNAVWSPGGGRLAFLVIDSMAVISPWIWRVGDDEPERVRDIDVQINFGDPPIVWLDSNRVLFLAWRPGVPKGGSLYMEVLRGQHAPELWTRAREGREASSTVFESRATNAGEARTDVVMVDTDTGMRRTVLSGRPHRLSASPSGRRLAYFSERLAVERASSFFEHEDLYDAVNWGTELHVSDLLSGEEVIDPVDVVSAGYTSLRWSAGDELEIPGYERGQEEGSGLLVSTDTGMVSVEVSGLADIEPASARWVERQLVVRARAQAEDRWDWWIVGPGGPRNITSAMDIVPSTLVRGPGGALVGVGGGDVWRVSSAGVPFSFGRALDQPIERLSRVRGARDVFVGTVQGRQSIVQLIDDTAAVTFLEPPREGARLLTVAPSGDGAIFVGNGSDGTRLWVVGGGGRPVSDVVEVWHGNQWISGVRGGQAQHFRYAGTDGQEYVGWVLLPTGHIAGRALPLIVEVYPGSIQHESASPFSMFSQYFLNQHLFAARGYAVLLPSLPPRGGRGAEMLRSLTVGVLPAVDTLIARGIVDPQRVGIVGQSAGGYATLGIIGHTTRFKAALVSAGYSNLASLYGTFYGQRRYGDGGDPQAGQVLRMLQIELGYANMRVPPWEAPDDYIGASPLFLAHNVETPVMLVHGDHDFIPIQQAEEYYTALYRQDKRVQLVRYAGEQHTPSTRGNVLDVWQRIDAWFGKLLGN